MKHFSTRVFVTILFPVLIVYVTVLLTGASWVQSSLYAEAIKQKTISLDNISRGISDWILSRVSEVLQLSWIPLYQSASDEAVHDYLTEWQDTLSFRYDRLLLIQSDGTYWATDAAYGTLDDMEYVSLFFDEGRLFVYAGPDRYGSVLRDHFVIGAPIFGPEGIVQILTGTVSTATLQRVFGFFIFHEFDSWMIVNSRGAIITHSDRTLIGRSERASYGKVFLENGDYGDVAVFVSVLRNGWKLVAFRSHEALMSPYAGVRILLLWFSVFLILLIIGLVTILSMAVVRPVRRLTDGVHRIMAGDYKTDIQLKTGDELQELADSFNRLSNRLVTLRTDDRFSFLGHISARMAHELRKPLHVIDLAAQSLRSEATDGSRYVEIIADEISQADGFIDQILNFAQTDNSEKILYSMDDLVRLTIEKYRLIGNEIGVQIDYAADPDIPRTYVDVMRMEETISNLLQNAIDSIAGGGVHSDSRVSVSLEVCDDSCIRLTVRDTGPGFDDTLIDRLFDPYFTTRDSGTGLGLSICYRVAMAHHARITLANDEGHHGTVTLEIPI